MNQRHVAPFEGEPITSLENYNGEIFYRIKPCELTAEDVKRVENYAVTAAIVSFILGIYLTTILPGQLVLWALLASFIPFFLIGEFEIYFAEKFSRESEIVLSPTKLGIKREDGWQVFDRTVMHSFEMKQHDLTREEHEERDMKMRWAQQRGRLINPKRYYEDSYHIIFRYLGTRYDMLEVYDQNRAYAVINRLQAVDQVMDNLARMGDGEALGPEDQWRDQPGDLP